MLSVKEFNDNFGDVKDGFRDMISYFRMYPDRFIDYIKTDDYGETVKPTITS